MVKNQSHSHANLIQKIVHEIHERHEKLQPQRVVNFLFVSFVPFVYFVDRWFSSKEVYFQ